LVAGPLEAQASEGAGVRVVGRGVWRRGRRRGGSPGAS
jgi:hypothetical protein